MGVSVIHGWKIPLGGMQHLQVQERLLRLTKEVQVALDHQMVQCYKGSQICSSLI